MKSLNALHHKPGKTSPAAGSRARTGVRALEARLKNSRGDYSFLTIHNS